MFELNLQTAVFFGTVALGALLFVTGVVAFVGTAVMLGAIRALKRFTEALRERLHHDQSRTAG